MLRFLELAPLSGPPGKSLIKSDKMANFQEILNHILGVVFIIIVFALAYAYLKPHQLHKRRLLSTLLLKGS